MSRESSTRAISRRQAGLPDRRRALCESLTRENHDWQETGFVWPAHAGRGLAETGAPTAREHAGARCQPRQPWLPRWLWRRSLAAVAPPAIDAIPNDWPARARSSRQTAHPTAGPMPATARSQRQRLARRSGDPEKPGAKRHFCSRHHRLRWRRYRQDQVLSTVGLPARCHRRQSRCHHADRGVAPVALPARPCSCLAGQAVALLAPASTVVFGQASAPARLAVSTPLLAGLTPSAARILASISAATWGCSFRYSRALSLPWPIRSPA